MNVNIRTCAVTLAVFGIGILGACRCSADVLFNQSFNLSGNYYGNPGYPLVYDDFTLAAGGTITRVDWFGIDPSTDITGFTLNIYSNNSGLPGTQLSTTTITGTAGETASGSFYAIYPINNYSGTLTTPFTAAPGTEYFLQVLGHATGPAGFYWETSDIGNNGAISGTTHLNKNLAFELEGAAVPEPNTILLALFGAAGFILRRRQAGS